MTEHGRIIAERVEEFVREIVISYENDHRRDSHRIMRSEVIGAKLRCPHLAKLRCPPNQ